MRKVPCHSTALSGRSGPRTGAVSSRSPQANIFLLENKSKGHILFSMYYVYMIKNKYGKLYIGVTQNTMQRLHHHNTKQGAQFAKSKTKFSIVFQEQHDSLAGARKREIQIKKWRRDKKEMLIEKFQNGLPTEL